MADESFGPSIIALSYTFQVAAPLSVSVSYRYFALVPAGDLIQVQASAAANELPLIRASELVRPGDLM